MHCEDLGAMLVENGLLDQRQLQQILQRRQREDRPFGDVARELLGLSEEQMWETCAAVMLPHCRRTQLADEPFDPAALEAVSAHDAWDHLVMPLRYENGELICATTEETLSNAIALLQSTADTGFHFVITDIRPLEQFIAERYAFEGVEVDG